MKKILALATAALMAVSLSACSTETTGSSSGASSQGSEGQSSSSQTQLTGTVSMSGSTSMEELAKLMAESFMEQNEGVTVDVQLGGSSVGVKNAQDGVTDIGNVSRELKDSETGLTPYTVAIDGISVIVNNENTVKDLTTEQIAKIYTGEITNWKDVGGEDMAIVVVGREAGSGTRGAFEEILGIEDQAKYGQELTETGSVKTAVETTKGAIGYVSMSYVDDKVTAVNVDGVEATEENAKAGTYALKRPFIMVVKEGEQRAEVQAFLDYVLSDAGQELVASLKLITVK